MALLLIVLVILLLFGGIGTWPSFGYHQYGYGPSGLLLCPRGGYPHRGSAPSAADLRGAQKSRGYKRVIDDRRSMAAMAESEGTGEG